MTVPLNIKIDAKLKKEAQELATQMGTTLSSVIKIYLTKFTTTRKLEIDLNDTLPYSKNKLSTEKEAQYLK